MKIVWLGVGSGCDKRYPNSSCVVMTAATNLLLDCGYSVPQVLWNMPGELGSNPDFLHGIYNSHGHFDHVGGLFPLLVGMREDGRKAPLCLIAQAYILSLLVPTALSGYRINEELLKGLVYERAHPSHQVELNDVVLSFASTAHAWPNLAIRIDDQRHVVCYSGDGEITEASEALYANADLLIHEGFTYDVHKPGHACMVDVIAMAERQNVKRLAFVHLHKVFRQREFLVVRRACTSKKVEVFFPEPGQEVELL